MLISILYLIFATLYIAGLFKSERDTIAFNPRKAIFQSDFWLEMNSGKPRTWLQKYPFAPLSDGWHLCDAGMLCTFYLMIGTLFILITKINFLWIFPFILGCFIIFGAFFNLNYDE